MKAKQKQPKKRVSENRQESGMVEFLDNWGPFIRGSRYKFQSRGQYAFAVWNGGTLYYIVPEFVRVLYMDEVRAPR